MTVITIFLIILMYNTRRENEENILGIPDNKLCHDFDRARMPSVTARVADVVAGQQFTGIADTGHDRIEVHEMISNREFMLGLHCGGTEQLYLEYMDVTMERIFQAYRDDRLSDPDLQLLGENILATSAEKDFNVDPKRSRQAMINYMKHAKEFGLDLPIANHMEGLLTEEEYTSSQQFGVTLIDVILNVVENDAQFKHIKTEDKFKYLQKTAHSQLTKKGVFVEEQVNALMDSRKQRLVKAVTAYVDDGESVGEAVKKVQSDMLQIRLSMDDEVAERIRWNADDAQAVIVYGKYHFNRRFFDLGASLGDPEDIKTIAVYGDREAQDKLRPPPSTSGLDWFYNQRMDYTLDAKTMTWQKGTNGALVQLAPLAQTQPQIAAQTAEKILHTIPNSQLKTAQNL